MIIEIYNEMSCYIGGTVQVSPSGYASVEQGDFPKHEIELEWGDCGGSKTGSITWTETEINIATNVDKILINVVFFDEDNKWVNNKQWKNNFVLKMDKIKKLVLTVVLDIMDNQKL